MAYNLCISLFFPTLSPMKVSLDCEIDVKNKVYYEIGNKNNELIIIIIFFILQITLSP